MTKKVETKPRCNECAIFKLGRGNPSNPKYSHWCSIKKEYRWTRHYSCDQLVKAYSDIPVTKHPEGSIIEVFVTFDDWQIIRPVSNCP